MKWNLAWSPRLREIDSYFIFLPFCEQSHQLLSPSHQAACVGLLSCPWHPWTALYSGKLRNKFSSSDSASVWKDMKDITSYKTPSPSTLENQQLADDLNEFYCRFEKTSFTPLATHTCTADERRWRAPGLQKYKEKEGSDCVPLVCLKSCVDQLAPIFTQNVNKLLELCDVPSYFKRSTIIPVPKKPKITGLRDLWLLRLWPWNHLKDRFWLIWRTPLDPYWTPCSLPTDQTGLWMIRSTWDCTSVWDCIWTDQGLMRGSCL